MIGAQDADFHFTPDSHWQWVETIALPFCVPEANIYVIVYVVARPILGVCMADVTIIDPDARWTVAPERFRSRSRNTPFAGWEVRGRHTGIVAGISLFGSL